MSTESIAGNSVAGLTPPAMRIVLKDLRDEGRYDQLLANAEEWCRSNPFDLEIGVLLAEAAHSLNNHMKSLQYFKRLVQFLPMNISMREHYCHHLVKTNRLEVSIQELRKILIIAPATVAHISNLAAIMRAIGDSIQAKKLYKRSAWADPTNPSQRWMAEKATTDEGVIGKLATESRKGLESPQFYRADQTRFFPRRIEDFDDIDAMLERDVFATFVPKSTLFRSNDTVIAFGSCFAGRIRKWLTEAGRLSRQIEVPEGLNNSFAIRQFFEWTLTGDQSTQDYWIDKNEDGSLVQRGVDEEREKFFEPMRNAGGFVLTYGLSEVWRDRRTGGVFWRGIPEARYMPDRHSFEVSTVEENVENIRRVIELVRTHCGDIPIILTLSPVPLTATMRENSIFASDCESKSILRVAIGQILREQRPSVYYWPAFEAVRWLGGHIEGRSFGEDNNPFHPSDRIVKRVIDLFVRSFFDPI
ncbi:GSCFA domain-containing protein [Thalassobaculum sp.]|uniref:GSCFA domain-containing protein n=1 Tax=Thalassobaculum sp. TaxID=2022740 RepID=UPI0032EAA678